MGKEPGLIVALWNVLRTTRRFLFSRDDIHVLAAKGKTAELEALLDENPQLVNLVDKMDYGTPLHWAAVYGQLESCQILLARDADVDVPDDCGGTALFWAISGGEAEVVRLLLAHGASLAHRNSDGRTPLEHALH